jgi:Tol biopolymer transport system component
MSGAGGSADLWLVEVDGSGMENLTQSNDDEFSPSWSPDGKRIVFVRQYATGDQIGGTDLFVLDVESGRVEPLLVTEAGEEYATWSPDGARIAFVSDHEFVLGAIYTIRPDGSDFRLVGARGRMPRSLTWSPSGDMIAFSANVGPGDDLRIQVIDAEGGTPRSVSEGAIDIEPVWAPRENEIVFVRGFEVRAVDVDTGEERALADLALLAAWYDEEGAVAFVQAKELLLLRDGESRTIARLRGLVYAPPAARPTASR